MPFWWIPNTEFNICNGDLGTFFFWMTNYSSERLKCRFGGSLTQNLISVMVILGTFFFLMTNYSSERFKCRFCGSLTQNLISVMVILGPFFFLMNNYSSERLKCRFGGSLTKILVFFLYMCLLQTLNLYKTKPINQI